MTRIAYLIISLIWCSTLTGCTFVAAAGAGFVGTVLGNLGSDSIEGKWHPGKKASDEPQQ